MSAVILDPTSKVICAILATNLTIGKISKQPVPSLRESLPESKTKSDYSYDDSILEEICSQHWR